MRCKAKTRTGRQCSNQALEGMDRCNCHFVWSPNKLCCRICDRGISFTRHEENDKLCSKCETKVEINKHRTPEQGKIKGQFGRVYE